MTKMDQPSQIYPTSPTSVPTQLPMFIPDPSIKGLSFDQLLQNRGIRFIHKPAVPCPNMRSLDDNSHDANCPICNGNGMLFYAEKEIWGVFSSNSLQKNFEQQGVWEIGSAVVTLPSMYPDGLQADFNTYDQLLIPDFEVRLWELKEYEPRVDGQRLRYPIIKTDYMASVNNGILKIYQQGIDFNIVNGNIQWVNGKQPAYDNATGRGDVFVVAYFAHPVYNVLNSMRELRITQEMINGQKIAKRMAQEVLVKRDFLFNAPETIKK
jgi:hypothetical protein